MSEIQNPEILEVVPGFSHDQLEGWIPPLATEDEIRGALEKAFDYRGDVTITLKNGTQVEGYIFDRQNGPTLADSTSGCFRRTTILSSRFPTRKSRPWRSPVATPPPGRVGKRGCENIGRRRPPVSTTSSVIPKRLSSRSRTRAVQFRAVRVSKRFSIDGGLS